MKKKYLIVVSRFNEEVTQPLLDSCLKGFKEQGILPVVIKVPGAVEIPYALQAAIQKYKPSAAVALGCVLQGETGHYSEVCRMCSTGIMRVMLQSKTPIVFEVLMMDKIKKAWNRIEKGYHAAYSAVEMSKFKQSEPR